MNVATGLLVAAAEEEHAIDETHHWLWPETPEIIYGGIAFVVVLLLFWKLGVFKMIAKGLSDRTAKIQQQLDDSAGARKAAETEAAEIRKAAGDIDAERERLLAAARVQAEELLVDGRARLETEVAELIADGRSNKEIAQALNISEPTVKKHVGHILGKLRLQDRLLIGLYVARNPLVLRRSDSGHA